MAVHAQKKTASEQIAERYEKLFAPADSLISESTHKPKGPSPEAYINAAKNIEQTIGVQERLGNRSSELYAAAAKKITGYLSRVPNDGIYNIARSQLKDSVKKWKQKAKQC